VASRWWGESILPPPTKIFLAFSRYNRVTTTFALVSKFLDPIYCQVGPRDGLQNEKTVVPTHIKVEFISRLAAAGLR
jgi:hypothetical protein